MKNDRSKIHPQLKNIAWLNPQLNLNKYRVVLINKVMPWFIKPQKCRDLIIENIFIDHPECDQKLRLRLYRPRSENKPLPALLWFHGGGYVIGTPEMDDKKSIEFALLLGIVVISVDYRLAPQHPFPAALEDGWAALKWAATEGEKMGIDPARIAIGGSSAGGGLAAALAQFTHDRQEISPAFQLLVYPMLDDRTVTRSDLKNRQFLIWPQESNQFGWESYLGQPCGEHALPMYAVPARREDLSGLPPAWIGVGSLDLFHDEVVAYAHNLSECGVKCELVVVPGAFHGFDVVSHRMPIIREFRDSQINALHENLNSSKNSPIKLKSVFISG